VTTAPRQAVDLLRLARAEGVGPLGFRRLLARFGSAEAALAALPDLARRGGRAEPPRVPGRDEAEREIAALDRLGARLLFVDGPDYPPLLATATDAPPVLAVRGSLAALQARPIAVVGSRNASANGQRLAERIADGLARAGSAVVSGLARGIDGAAHRGALRAGLTVACVAGGIDVPYPPEHADLMERIAEAGAVVATSPPGTAPMARHFPRRNRVIAGLSLGVVVVEAAPRSGSLITARLGLEYNREVFAVPGSPLDPRAQGTNGLIKAGEAHLVETAEDVLAALGSASGPAIGPLFPALGAAETADAFVPAGAEPGPAEHAEIEAALLDLLGPAPTAVDDLIRRCQFSAPAVMSVLLDLEIAGRIETLAGNRVALLSDDGN
jgi:DNA processing protein